MKSILFSILFMLQPNPHKEHATLNPASIKQCKMLISNFYKSLYQVHAAHAHDTAFLKDKVNQENILKMYPNFRFKFIPNYFDAPAFTFQSLTYGLSEQEIMQQIEKMELLDFENHLSYYAILKLKVDQFVFFDIFCEIPEELSIDHISLSNGNSLGASIDGRFIQYSCFPGHLKEELTKIPLHEKPDNKSAIMGNILRNSLFYYTPIPNSTWVKVINEYQGNKVIGYIPQSSIGSFKTMPKKIKKQYHKNFDC